MTTPRIRYNITFMSKSGLRTLLGAAQSRVMHDTRESAEKHLAALLTNTGEDRLAEIFGEQSRGTWRVDPFECYSNGDPKTIYAKD